jgi:hypothetical protein
MPNGKTLNDERAGHAKRAGPSAFDSPIRDSGFAIQDSGFRIRDSIRHSAFAIRH